jgi:hypothetical protein
VLLLEVPSGLRVVVVTVPSGLTVVVIVPGLDAPGCGADAAVGGITSLFETLHGTHNELPKAVPGHVPAGHEFCCGVCSVAVGVVLPPGVQDTPIDVQGPTAHRLAPVPYIHSGTPRQPLRHAVEPVPGML